jgi:hypothetical protein
MDELWKEGDKCEILCPFCHIKTSTTFVSGRLELKNGVSVSGILLGVCDRCRQNSTIPAQSVEQIKQAL